MPGEYTRKLKKLFGNFTKIINSKKKKSFCNYDFCRSENN
jgi:hypothetical protein